jgi:hypothetical protein
MTLFIIGAICGVFAIVVITIKLENDELQRKRLWNDEHDQARRHLYPVQTIRIGE